MAQLEGEENSSKVIESSLNNEQTQNESKGDGENKEQESKLTVTCTPEYDSFPYNQQSEHFLFMSSIKAPYFRANQRASIDLICVVDESSSMQGERIKMVRETVTFIIQNLESQDRFGIVGYHDHAETLLELTKMDEQGKKTSLEIVKSINTKGSTALCDGLVQSIQLMKARKPKDCNPIASVMLFTDGEANIGFTDARDIIAAMKNPNYKKSSSKSPQVKNVQRRLQSKPQPQQQFQQQQQQQQPVKQESKGLFNLFKKANNNNNNNQQKQGEISQDIDIQQQQQLPQLQQQIINPNNEGEDNDNKQDGVPTNIKKEQDENNNEELCCTVNTFGFGQGHNENLLSAIAESGRGMYTFIENTEMIADVFAQCLGGLVSIVAQEIEIHFKTINNVKINKCLSDAYKMQIIKPNEYYIIHISDIQSEERRDLIWDLQLPKLQKMDDEFNVVEIHCKYTNSITEQKEEIKLQSNIKRGDESSELGERNVDLDIQNNRILAAQAMEEADVLAKNNDLKNARERLENAVKVIEKSRTKDNKFSKQLIQDMKRCQSGLQDSNSYQSHGGKMLNMNSKAHKKQRAVNSSAWNSQEAYSNESQVVMKSKFKK